MWVAAALLLSVSVAHADAAVGTDYSSLNQGDSEKNYREREFRAYKPVEEQAQKLKTGISSYMENPTGIAFAAGEKVRINEEGYGRFTVPAAKLAVWTKAQEPAD